MRENLDRLYALIAHLSEENLKLTELNERYCLLLKDPYEYDGTGDFFCRWCSQRRANKHAYTCAWKNVMG